MKMVLLLGLIGLSGCENCIRQFEDGSIVHHRLIEDRYLVLGSASIKNYEGFCLVQVRREKDGKYMVLVATELRK